MKLVYCIAGTYRPGGMERVLTNKANYLSALNYEVHIITTDQRGQESFFPLDENIKCHDLDINYELNNGKSVWNKLIMYPFKRRKHKKRLASLLKEIKADVVVSTFCHEESFVTGIRDGSKKVLEIHFSKFKRLQYGREGLWRRIDEWRSRQDEKIVSKFDKFIVLTEEDKFYWGNFHNILVIPNSLTFNTDQFALLKNKRIITAGRYDYQKGLDILIDIWRDICLRTDDWHLEIIGEGDLRAQLQKQIDDYRINDRITLSGTNRNMMEKYLDASIVVLTSRYEGLPMVLLEAQSFGLPIVSFQCKCGPKDIVTDGVNGFLVSEGDKGLFSERLMTLMNDEDLRKQMGSEAKKASLRFAEDKVKSQWINLFESLAK